MKRNGFTITEVIVAIAILGVVLAVALQVMSTTVAADARFHRRQLAIQEVQNQLERVEMLAWEALSAETAKSLVLSDAAKEQLNEAQIAVQVDQQAESEKLPPAKRVVVMLTWQEPTHEKASEVQLVTWRFSK